MQKQSSTSSVTRTGNVQSLKAQWEAKAAAAQTSEKKPEQRGRETTRKPDDTKVLFQAPAPGAREKAKSSRSGSRSPEKKLVRSKRTSDGLRDQINRSASSEMKLTVQVSKAAETALLDIVEPRPGSPKKSALNLKELKTRLEEVGSRQGTTTPTRTSRQESPKKVQFVQDNAERSVQRSRSQSPRKPLPKVPSRIRAVAVDELIHKDSIHSPAPSAVEPVENQPTTTPAAMQAPAEEHRSPQATPRSPLSPQPAPRRLTKSVTTVNQAIVHSEKKDKD